MIKYDERVLELARSLVNAMLARRTVTTIDRRELQFGEGSAAFAALHRACPTPEELIELLDFVALALTNKEPRAWRISPCDPALVEFRPHRAVLILRPAQAVITNLMEVPNDLLIFELDTHDTCAVWHAAAPAAKAITYRRGALGLRAEDDKWLTDFEAIKLYLLAEATAELAKQQAAGMSDMRWRSLQNLLAGAETGDATLTIHRVMKCLHGLGVLHLYLNVPMTTE